MNSEEIKRTTLEVLMEVVPELEPATLDARVSFRDQIEIDSIDYLNFVLALEKRLGIKIPEIDYPRLSSLDGCTRYLTDLLAKA
ncbi:MAG: acyl carrier protein [Candidatus Thiodiazotropha sp.]